MKHPHPEILQAYALDTSVEIECRGPHDSIWQPISILYMFERSYAKYSFRLKPKERCVVIDGVEYKFPEPLRVTPEVGTMVYMISAMYGVTAYCCEAQFVDLDYAIKAGFCQATEAGAQAQRLAIIALNGGCA